MERERYVAPPPQRDFEAGGYDERREALFAEQLLDLVRADRRARALLHAHVEPVHFGQSGGQLLRRRRAVEVDHAQFELRPADDERFERRAQDRHEHERHEEQKNERGRVRVEEFQLLVDDRDEGAHSRPSPAAPCRSG